MTAVFIDTGGFYALLDARDAHHAHAVTVFTKAQAERWTLVTTNAVVYETHALVISRRFPDSRQAALRFLAAIQAGLCDVRRVTAEDEGHATEILRTHADKSYSYCDALSFTVMERMGLTHAIAFDRHFREYGRWTLL